MAIVIDSTFHIQFDGTLYRLAESEEGAHYDVAGESVRPPNAVPVQGDQGKFQGRLDTLLWDMTDWSGGEGKIKWSAEEANRAFKINGASVFDEPGKLKPGYHLVNTSLNVSVALVSLDRTLYAFDKNDNDYYAWGGSSWGSATALTGVTGGCGRNIVADNDAIYWVERGTNNVWKWPGTGSPTKISDTLIDVPSGADPLIAEAGDYVYVYEPGTATIWEIAKSGSSEESIDEWTATGIGYACALTSMDGRVYAMVADENHTVVREITPSSAAGTGFGAEVMRVHGFEGRSMWAHTGQLFIVGTYDEDVTETAILYFGPADGKYGTLGKLRSGESLGVPSQGTSRMLDMFFMAGDNDEQVLYQIDSVSGGVAGLSINNGLTGDWRADSIVQFEGDIFISTFDSTWPGFGVSRTFRARKSIGDANAEVISAIHDFEYAGTKYLGSITVNVEDLDTDWNVYVQYKADGATSWSSALSLLATENLKTKTFVISTDSSTVEFNTLQIRTRLLYEGVSTPTGTGVITGIQVRAAVADKTKVFRLMVDLNDPYRGGSTAQSGYSKAQSFRTSAEKTTVLDLRDGYVSRDPGVYATHDVTVDGYRIILDRPGEGVGLITLREVV